MKILAVIPTMPHNVKYAELCVRSLLDTTDFLIAVVVNGNDGKALTDYEFPIEDDRVKLIVANIQGQCHAVNMGSQMLQDYDYLFVTNDDMYYAPGWMKELDEWPLCWSPNLIEPTNNAGSAPPFLKLDAGLTVEEFDKDKVDEFIREHDELEETTGFNLPFFIRHDLWVDIRGFDEYYDPWGSNSDTDLQTKVELAGVQPMRLRDHLVYHFSNKSGTFDGSHQTDWQRNWDYYTEKWGFNRDDEPIPDTWMATKMVNREKLIWHPDFEGKYA